MKKSYKLKYKDNFWDLSKTFFKDNLYWSKLWVANPLIENPHRIYKGDSIKFDIKTLSAVNTSEYSTPLSEQFPGIQLPDQLYKRRSLREYEMPSSLPFIKKNINLESVSSEIYLSLDPVQINRQALLPFYLSEESPQKDGEVISKDSYGSKAFNGENIIVTINDEVSIGDRYTVFKNRGRLKFSLFNLLQKSNGYEIQINGEIKILNYLVGTDSTYRAQVVKSLKGITKGDSIYSGRQPSFTLSQKGSYGTANGSLLESPNKRRNMLSLYSIVYLDKGKSHGVRVDDLYNIRAKSSNNLKKHSKRPYKYKQPSIGQLRVIHAASDVSTAVIIQAKDQIFINDLFSSSLGSISDLEQSESHESIESSEDIQQDFSDSEEIEEDFSDSEEIEEDSEEIEEDFSDSEEIEEDFSDSEEIEEDSEEIEEDSEEEDFSDSEEIEEDSEGEDSEENMKDIQDEFKDLEDLEDLEEIEE